MTTPTGFSPIRSTTPPPENKVLTDEDLDAILSQAFEEMNAPSEPATTVPSLPPPLRSDRVDESELFAKVQEMMQSGSIDLSVLQGMMPDKRTVIRSALQNYEEDPVRFESTLLMMEQLDMGERSVIPFSDLSGAPKQVKLSVEKMTETDEMEFVEMQQKILQSGSMDPGAMANFFDRLVREKKAEYVTPKGVAFSDSEKGALQQELENFGCSKDIAGHIINHRDAKIALSVMHFDVLCHNKDLLELYVEYSVKESADEGDWGGFVKTLPSERAALIKQQSIAFLQKRLGL